MSSRVRLFTKRGIITELDAREECITGLKVSADFIHGLKEDWGKPLKDYISGVRAKVDDISKKSGETPSSINIIFALSLSPQIGNTEALYNFKAEMEILRIVTVVKIYITEKGIFPEKLDDLCKNNYLSSIPKDPFIGENLKYKISKDGKSATIYSVGKDFKDNGGIEESDIPFTVELMTK